MSQTRTEVVYHPVYVEKIHDQLFDLERLWCTLSSTERLKEQQAQAKPLVVTFFRWLDTLNPMKGALQKACQYTLKLKETLQTFLDHGELVISNNLAERNIRPITIGRKNWYFSTSAEGADANAICYSLIQTAKENGLDAYAYLT